MRGRIPGADIEYQDSISKLPIDWPRKGLVWRQD
jgi:hypothetical protein